MYLLYLSTTLLLLWVSLAGITLATYRHLPDIALARTAGLLLAAILLFFIEHFAGLGTLNWVLPLLVTHGAWQLYKLPGQGERQIFFKSEMVFAIAILFGLLWRWGYPNITSGTEALTDLFFISNYYPGSTLPPQDNWNPADTFDYYYAFQHYVAALIGRIFNLEIGLAYNLGFILFSALTLTLAWRISCQFIQHKTLRLVLIASLALGGTGLSPIFHLVFSVPENPIVNESDSSQSFFQTREGLAWRNIVDSSRFIGESRERNLQDNAGTNLGLAQWLLPARESVENTPAMILPSENFGYQYFLGDFHPPLGGFLLLMLALAVIVNMETSQVSRRLQALLAMTVPLVLITNTWVMPLQVLLIGGWIVQRSYWHKDLDWAALIGGGLAGTFLIYPFLSGFAPATGNVSLQWVGEGQHTPVARFLAMHWPVLLLLLFCTFESQYRRLALTMASIWLCLLVMSEFLFIDDVTAEQYSRTNTTMKWWGWIQTGVLVSCGALCLGSARRWVRWGSCIVLLLLNSIAIDLVSWWWFSDRPEQGQLSGHGWFTADPVKRQMFEYLENAPRGVVVEPLPDNAYMNTSIYGIFNDKPVLLGWPSHLMTWQGDVPRVWQLKTEIDAFYRAELINPAGWLASNQVDYVVMGPEADDSRHALINSLIVLDFTWHEFDNSGQRHSGIWVRNSRLPAP